MWYGVKQIIDGKVAWLKYHDNGDAQYFREGGQMSANLDAITYLANAPGVGGEVVPLMTPEEVEAREKAAFEAGWKGAEARVNEPGPGLYVSMGQFIAAYKAGRET